MTTAVTTSGGASGPAAGAGVNADPAAIAGGTSVAPAAPPEDKRVVFESPDQLNERLARHHRSQLKKLGIDSDEQLAALLKEREDRARADEEAKRAAMTREQQMAEDLAAANAKAAAASAALEEARFDAHVTKICVEKGIKNLGYAKYLVAEAADALPDGQQLDAGAFLAEKLADAQAVAALGASLPQKPIETVTVPGHTGIAVTPVAAPPAGGSQATTSAFDMTPAQWAARRAALGIG